MQASSHTEDQRIRAMVERLGFLTEEDFRVLAGVNAATVAAWRHRGQGPAFVRVGRRVFFPQSAVAAYMTEKTRAPRPRVAAGALL
jgi:predicted site-specific integrase-resolvase